MDNQRNLVEPYRIQYIHVQFTFKPTYTMKKKVKRNPTRIMTLFTNSIASGN